MPCTTQGHASPQRAHRSFLIRAYAHSWMITEIGRGAPQDRYRASDLHVRRHTEVLMEQGLLVNPPRARQR